MSLNLQTLAGRDVRLVLSFDRIEQIAGVWHAHWTLISWMELSEQQIASIIPDSTVQVKIESCKAGSWVYNITSFTDSK